MDPIEARNDEIHRRVAALIRRDPTVIAKARATLDRWLASSTEPALVEWQNALAMFEPEQLARFLESETPRAKRMRISSPFVGLVPRVEP